MIKGGHVLLKPSVGNLRFWGQLTFNMGQVERNLFPSPVQVVCCFIQSRFDSLKIVFDGDPPILRHTHLCLQHLQTFSLLLQARSKICQNMLSFDWTIVHQSIKSRLNINLIQSYSIRWFSAVWISQAKFLKTLLDEGTAKQSTVFIF